MDPQEKRQLTDLQTNFDKMSADFAETKKYVERLLYTMGQILPTEAGGFSSGQNFSLRMPNLLASPSGPSIGSGITIVNSALKVWNGSSWGNAAGNFYVPMTLINTEPQTANNFLGPKFIAKAACKVVSIQEVHYQGGTSPSLMIQKNGPGGTDLLASALSLTGGGNSVQSGTLHGTPANLAFAVGDVLTWGISGTLTNLMGVCVIVEFQPT